MDRRAKSRPGDWKWAGTHIVKFSCDPNAVDGLIEEHRRSLEADGKEIIDSFVEIDFIIGMFEFAGVELLVRPKSKETCNRNPTRIKLLEKSVNYIKVPMSISTRNTLEQYRKAVEKLKQKGYLNRYQAVPLSKMSREAVRQSFEACRDD